jgi:uncharacterized protein
MNRFKYILFCAALLGTMAQLTAQNDCFPQQPNGWIVDEANVFTQEEQSRINAQLEEFTLTTSNQIVILIVNDLCGMDPAMYATEIGHEWGVGQEKLDNGAVILVKPTGGQGQRAVHIAIGYGLEGTIPDAIAKRIVEQEMIPRFSQGDIKGGILAGTSVVMDMAKGEYNSAEYAKSNGSGASGFAAIIPILFIIFIAFISRFSGARSYARRNNTSFWLALLLMNSMGSHRGSYGNFSSGRGSFGGGGGFSGFGGGGFGGGGAGGRW